MAQMLIIHTDGGARGNPGPAAVGIVVADEQGTVLKEVGEYIGTATNNFAEYEAVVRALEHLKKIVPKPRRSDTHLHFFLDSELVVKQLTGEYQIKEETLWPQFMKIWNFRVAEFPHVTFAHVPREKNKEADALVNKALDTLQNL